MTRPITLAALIAGALALTACQNADRFGAAGPGGPGASVGSAIPGGPADPSSPAYFRQTIGDRVLFAVDQFTLTDQARATLSGQARWLAENPAYTAVIEGHADEQGTREYNLGLSERRASSARDFLVAQGVAPGRLRTVAFGKERPVELCSTEDCYAQNRRAVTVIAAGGLS